MSRQHVPAQVGTPRRPRLIPRTCTSLLQPAFRKRPPKHKPGNRGAKKRVLRLRQPPRRGAERNGQRPLVPPEAAACGAR